MVSRGELATVAKYNSLHEEVTNIKVIGQLEERLETPSSTFSNKVRNLILMES